MGFFWAGPIGEGIQPVPTKCCSSTFIAFEIFGIKSTFGLLATLVTSINIDRLEAAVKNSSSYERFDVTIGGVKRLLQP